MDAISIAYIAVTLIGLGVRRLVTVRLVGHLCAGILAAVPVRARAREGPGLGSP